MALDFTQPIIDAIGGTSVAVLFFLSESSQNSAEAKKEVAYALRFANKRVVFVRFNDDPLTDAFKFNYGVANIRDWRNPLQKQALLADLEEWRGPSERSEGPAPAPVPAPAPTPPPAPPPLTYEEQFARLNDRQREAVMADDGYIRVIAGAGSGKTLALACRYVRLLKEGLAAPENILCVTFTNKAALEMKTRIQGMLGPEGAGFNGLVKTIHSFCRDVIKKDCNRLNWPSSFDVLDEDEVSDILNRVLSSCGIRGQDVKIGNIKASIRTRKETKDEEGRYPYLRDLLADSEAALRERYDRARQAVRDAAAIEELAYCGLLLAQRALTAITFDDFVPMAMELFKTSPEVLDFWSSQLVYIMVDEFQDVNEGQFDLVRLLSRNYGNLFVVGDDDQTIHTFRGASPRFFLSCFEEAFPGARTIVLDENYRSTPQVVNGANTLIERNRVRYPKELAATRRDGTDIVCHVAQNQAEEGAWIAARIAQLHARGVPYRDIAVLASNTKPTFIRPVEEGLRDGRIPYEIVELDPFYKRKDVKVVLAYLRLLADRSDDAAFLRCLNVPARNIRRPLRDRLWGYAKEHNCALFEALRDLCGDPGFAETGAKDFVAMFDRLAGDVRDGALAELVPKVLDLSGYGAWIREQGDEDRESDFTELTSRIQRFAAEFGGPCTLADYLKEVEKAQEIESYRQTDTVKVMTIHKAKGLEFPYVFVFRLNDGTLPDSRSTTPEAVEEDRRKTFVAMTRAKEQLYLTAIRDARSVLSRFLFEIDPRFLVFDPPLPDRERDWEAMRQETAGRVPPPPPPVFRAGDRVSHPTLGAGTVVSQAGSVCRVAFDGSPNAPRPVPARSLRPL